MTLYEDLTEASLSVIDFLSRMYWTTDQMWNVFAFLVTGVAIFLPLFFFKKLFKRNEPEQEQEEETIPARTRFRKRDKMEFYAKKVLRKGRDTATKIQNKVSNLRSENFPAVSRSGRRLQKRERMLILARRVFGRKKQPALLIKKDLPSELLEADATEEGIPNLPEEVLYLLQSVKVFGHFEKGVFLHLCRHMETIKLEADGLLFDIGEEDKWMYVVQEGHVNLYIKVDNTEVKLSEFTVGESLHSLLSILDVLTGHSEPYKTVYARAVERSTVIRLPVDAFKNAFQNREWSLVQMVQVIMTRLQRVTFLALHNYLGLSQELLRPVDRALNWYLAQTKNNTILARGRQMMLKDLAKRHNSLVDFPELPPEIATSSTAIETAEEEKKRSESADSNFETQPPLTCDAPTLQHQRSDPIQIATNNNNKQKTIRSKSTDRQLRFNPTVKSVLQNDEVFFAKTDQGTNSDEELPRCSHSLSGTNQVDEGNLQTDETIYPLNEPEVLELITTELSNMFDINDHELVKNHLKLFKVCLGHQLVREGDQEVSLYLVVTGKLRVFQSTADDSTVTLFTAETGMLTGQLAVLTGEPSFFGVTALIDSVIAQLTRQSFYVIMRSFPQIVLNTAHTVMLTVSPFVRQIDFALDWVKVEAGKSLYKQGSNGDCMYIILHGRLRSVFTKTDGKKELVAEYGRGEIVGINEALSEGPRTVSLHAIRDTELAKMPEGLVKHIRRIHPGVVTRLISLASDKLLGNIMQIRNRTPRNTIDILSPHKTCMQEENSMAYGDVSNHLANLSTVAILPASQDVPLKKFAMELHHSLTHICSSVLRLDSEVIKKRLGYSALDSVHEYRLSNWLASSEDSHRIVLYQTDYNMSPWTQRCIRQADAVLIVALGDGEYYVGDLESQVEAMAVRALKMLVLLHRPGVIRPSGTVEWLNCRTWVTNYTHIKGPPRLFARTRASKMADYWQKLTTKRVDRFSDFSRLARFLTGTSVALVLGGGGARGLSQLGIIKSMIEKDIPIDMIGGTSIGSFVGGLWAAHRDLTLLREKMILFSVDMGSIGAKILDLTYPVTSMFSGGSFNNAIRSIFEDIQIEDLWVPYFCITTDITSSEMRVHTDGWLWRYVRASMSLSGYLPPICDPKDGHLLMDGGYVNNLPGDVARTRGAYKVIAVDVGSANDVDFTNYGDKLSGWWLLWKRFTGRWTGRVKVPDMNDIQSRLSYISSCFLLEKVRRSEYCFYVRPPVEKYKTLEFNRYQELIELGHDHGHRVFTADWSREFWDQLRLQLAKRHVPFAELGYMHVDRKDSEGVSFTDLSEIIKQKSSVSEHKLDDAMKDFLFDYEPAYDSSPEMSQLIYTRLQRMSSEPYNLNKIASDTSVDDSNLLDQAVDQNSKTTMPRYKNMRRAYTTSKDSDKFFRIYSSDDDDVSGPESDSGHPLSASL